MRKLLFTTILAIVLCASGTLVAQESVSAQNRYIETSVRVSKEVTPDEIFIDFTINEKDNKGKISVQEQEKAAVNALKGLGIDVEQALTIDAMGSSLKTNFIKKDNIFISKNYTLKVGDAKLAASVIEALNKLQIAKVAIGKVSVSSKLEEQVKNQLLVEAAKKTKANAQILAEAVGSKAGNAIYIQNYYSFDSASNGRVMLKSAKAYGTLDTAIAEEESVELEVSKQTLSINVSCKFELL